MLRALIKFTGIEDLISNSRKAGESGAVELVCVTEIRGEVGLLRRGEVGVVSSAHGPLQSIGDP